MTKINNAYKMNSTHKMNSAYKMNNVYIVLLEINLTCLNIIDGHRPKVYKHIATETELYN